MREMKVFVCWTFFLREMMHQRLSMKSQTARRSQQLLPGIIGIR
jgi:hypothetical protein